MQSVGGFGPNHWKCDCLDWEYGGSSACLSRGVVAVVEGGGLQEFDEIKGCLVLFSLLKQTLASMFLT